MFKFIKIKDYQNWFLLFDVTTPKFSKSDKEVFKKNMLDFVLSTCDPSAPDIGYRLELVIRQSVTDVLEQQLILDSNTKICVRGNGSWTTLQDDDIIIDTVFHDTVTWPIDGDGKLIVCENDFSVNNEWWDKLSYEFPNYCPTTVNNFFARSQSEIQRIVDNADVITFTTTFSNLDWFDKLYTALYRTKQSKKLYFHCSNDDIWSNILEKYPRIITHHDLQIV